MVLPKSNLEYNSKGEKVCWEKMLDFLPSNYVSFHNYLISTQQVDWILLVPDLGALIIEIKGFKPDSIEYAIDNTNILMTNGTPERSPYIQCLRYWKRLNKRINEEYPDLKGVYVAKAICYPFLSVSDIQNKKLNRLCDEKLIITKEDLSSFEALSQKISDIFSATYEVVIYNGASFGFNAELKRQFANMISPDCVIDEQENEEPEKTIYDIYSHLITYSGSELDDRINSLYEEWKQGTKIYYFSASKDSVETLRSMIKQYIEDIGAEDLIDKDLYFNASIEYSPKIKKDFEILNGENASDYKDILVELGKMVSLNAEQYLIEHLGNKDIIVKAGAGTGKTFLLVSRIAFLCWDNKYSPDDLLNKMVLITFTNDATDEMRTRLEKHFSKLFELTYDRKYFEYVEVIENMRISTIDSLSLRIVKKFAYYLGVGKDLGAFNGTVVKRNAVHEVVNNVLAKKQTLDLNSFEIENFLLEVIKKFEDKNIDLKNSASLYFEDIKENDNSILADYLIVIPQIVERIEDECEKKGKIITGNILIYLQRIADMLKNGKVELKKEFEVEHLFIDEFQDTDDSQIELVAQFKKALGFNLFVVGDVKQSIYRFRGAIDDRAFVALQEKIGEEIDTYPLKKNYRTNAKLLAYMDSVFKKMASTNGGGKENLLKYTEDDVLAGVINPDAQKELMPIRFSSEAEREASIVEYIREFSENCDQKETLGILVRKRSEILKIRDICAKYGILNVDIDVGGQFYKYESTIDFYKLVLALQYNKDSKYLFNLYTTSYVTSTVDKCALVEVKNLTEYFYENLPKPLSNWNEYIKKLQYEPVLKVLREIVNDVLPWEIYSKKVRVSEEETLICKNRYRNNIEKLFEKIAIDFNGDYLTLNSLSNFLSIMISTEQEEEERELESSFRISCRTIHRAKGKEYTYVLLPFCDDLLTISSKPKDCDVVVNSDGLGYSYKMPNNEYVMNDFYDKVRKVESQNMSYEEARILYVAITRAKKGLAYIYSTKQAMKKTIRWQDVLEVDD